MLRISRIAWIVCIAMIGQCLVIECQADSDSHELTNAVLWVQTAAEYEAICEQNFALARIRLLEGLKHPKWTAALEQAEGFQDLPPAVIVDVDETVLSNSQFDARLAADGIDYDQGLWNQWVKQARARPLPGAKAFIDYAAASGVEVFFVTNRRARSEKKTAANLSDAFNSDITEDHLLCRGERDDWGTDKSTRRSYLARTHRILLLLGDDLNDFVSLGNATPRERTEKVHEYRQHWGTRWIILPNPLYGSWERALYDYDDKLSRREKLRIKRDALDIQK